MAVTSRLIFEIACTLREINSPLPDRKPLVNVYAYERPNTLIPTTKDALEAIFQSSVVVNLMGLLSSNVEQVSNKIRALDDALDPYLTVPRVVTGSVTGDMLPVQNSVKVGLVTASRGRNFVGSKHYSGIAESDTVNDGLDSTPQGAWRAFIPTLATPLTDSNGQVWTPCVVSRSLSQLAVNPCTVVYADILTATFNTSIGTTNRRKHRPLLG